MKYVFWLILLLSIGCRKQTAEAVADPTEIRLTCGVWGVVVRGRAVVDRGRFAATVCGWQQHSASVDWAAAPSWTSGADVLVGSSALAVDLVPAQMYNDKGLTTVVRAWHPTGKLEGDKVRFDNPTAELDILLAGAVSGTMNQPIATPLLFAHLTTQFRFVLTGSWFSEEPILSIKVCGVRVPVGLDLATGLLLGREETVDLMVQGVPTEGVAPNAMGVGFGRPMMVLPIEGNRIKVDVTTPRKTYENIVATTTDTQFTAGRSYTVTLSFNGNRHMVVGSSEIGDWPQDGQGSADVM